MGEAFRIKRSALAEPAADGAECELRGSSGAVSPTHGHRQRELGDGGGADRAPCGYQRRPAARHLRRVCRGRRGVATARGGTPRAGHAAQLGGRGPGRLHLHPGHHPLILAAHRDNYEIIKILLDRGATLPAPHDIRCACSDCVRSCSDDSLNHSRPASTPTAPSPPPASWRSPPRTPSSPPSSSASSSGGSASWSTSTSAST
ncbi:transient receptor potential-gamma protein [Caerostris extrusa]|uniref:Transient receptor potential-gamma protein n=1 Tax=Caerostris extrusa TaxID=172846 RepID=A0AAV4QRC9_CAEEX|nr:transient receptor potential-gamma protein [Caerostris extrusa]